MGCSSSQPRIKKFRDFIRVGYLQSRSVSSKSEGNVQRDKSKSYQGNNTTNQNIQQINQFDDQQVIKGRGQNFNKINAIKVSYTDNIILNMEVAYELDDGSIITGESSRVYAENNIKQTTQKDQKCVKSRAISECSPRNLQREQFVLPNTKVCTEVFEILQDDYLFEISGSANSCYVEQIKFKTYRGFEGIFGEKKSGIQFSFKEQGQTFGPFSGAFKQSIDLKVLAMFEFKLVETPSDFLISLHKSKKRELYANQVSSEQTKQHQNKKQQFQLQSS
ncbi:hypothetical protein TTHERM_00041490 (macronuclear) [Tetrahymena thermophila SB210]|uniref:Jacalin-type lectin domain-containing protein n=1 Tax=Tetrahymena thermophila (strain SB210) TaxID=312017 RepID=Q22LW8_TETTS|nr:hypothetical protein TTHERM_00041490 [Tetrahymena thermophila SB210]EAR86618.1 hypothetical protein TTHERM_00041490 [Tetrahymena thermophila SB210]|eukprot:XP_977252.1 hypothetical protein TTHERM_00041490 [Tetrahymena thermophila SB210]